jgi:sarcosine oxidase subunit beta
VSGLFRRRTFWRDHPIAPSYDVVVIGGGAHGLAIAYELAHRHGVRSIAVLDKAYIGAGGSGRNTTILRANYKTPEGIAFYGASLARYRELSQELDFNLLLTRHGHLTLAHSERSVAVQRERAEANQLLGVDSRYVDRDEVGRICPQLNLSRDIAYPILGALYHPPGAVIRHDAVVWAYARRADQLGVHVHQHCEVTGIDASGGRVTGVQTTRGPIKAGTVVSAVAGWTTTVTEMLGIETPLTNHPLQAYVTEPAKPVLDTIIVSAGLHVYVSQTDRGEFLIGAEIEPYTTYSTRSTWAFVEQASATALELLPFLARQKVQRQWTGYCDMTPDYSPIMGLTEVEGFVLDSGWGTWGFKASPICGVTIAELVATGRVPDLIAPFALDRFEHDRMVPEKGAAAVSH